MKRIAFLFLAMLCIPASAQYSVLYHLGKLNGTNTTLTANSVSNYTSFLPLSVARSRYVAVQASFEALANVTNTFDCLLQSSLDNTNWNNIALLTVTSAGTNRAVGSTNSIDVGMSQWLRLAYATNNVSTNLTNVTVLAAYKVAIAQKPYDALGYDLQPASANLTNWATVTTNQLTTRIISLSVADTNSTTTGEKVSALDATTGTGKFKFEYWLRYQSSQTTNGVKFSVNHSGGGVDYFVANMRYGSTGGAAATADATQAGNSATGNIHESFTTRTLSITPNLGPTVGVDAANSNMLAVIEGLISVTTNGVLQLYHASETANASSIQPGSALILTKLD